MKTKNDIRKVKYAGNIRFFDGDYNVLNVAHDGEPIGNGEINNSGADMYVCVDKAGNKWLFRADEVAVI